MIDALDRRFLKLEEVAEMFSTSLAQTYALVRRGELRAIKFGRRGQWRVEMTEVEAFIEKAYDKTAEYLPTHPLHDTEEPATAFPGEHDFEE